MQSTEIHFKICKEKFGPYEVYKLTNSVTGEYAAILPIMGGAINGLRLKFGQELIDIIDGYKSAEDMRVNLQKSFKGSNLFPFPNRIADGIYQFAGQKHSLPVNFPNENNAIHGLVYDREFKVVDQNDGHRDCVLTLRYSSPNQSQGYPFKYTMEQVYQWKENSEFNCTTIIKNISNCEMPLGHGWHPYFMAGSDVIDDLTLKFPDAEILEVDQRNIPTGRSKQYSEFTTPQKINGTILDNCFRLKNSGQYANIIISNPEKSFSYRILQETGRNKYNFLQIYTPPERRSIAIEPMTCAPNAFNNNDGLITLSSGSTLSLSWSISPYYCEEG